MIQTTKEALGKTFLTGLVLLLPLFIFVVILGWLYGIVTGVLEPITGLVTRTTGIPGLIGNLLVLAASIAVILLIGLAARTTAGRWLSPHIDHYMQRVAPGYRLIREIVQQLFGNRENSPFAHGSVALVKLYGHDVDITVTAIVTSRHEDGTCTVFVPTGPNPTSGFIYHVARELVQIRPDIRVEAALRTVIACGTGASDLLHPTSPSRIDDPAEKIEPDNPPPRPDRTNSR